MILDQLRYISPEICLLAFVLLLVAIDIFVANKKVLFCVALSGVVLSIIFALLLWGVLGVSVFSGALAIDPFGLFFKLLILMSSGLVILASHNYVLKFEKFQGEYYALLLLSTIGLSLLVSSTNLITMYVALEISSISLYALVSFMKDAKSSEAGLKYLILGAVASAILLYGMALTFGLTGSISLSGIADALRGLIASGVLSSPMLLIAMVLVITGFGFKIASVPFHLWAPDVYEGAPTPVTAYLSVASKAAGFAVIIRILTSAFGVSDFIYHDWALIIAILSAITMTVGNISAIVQTNIKRLFGFSSIAQAGYLMVGLAAIGLAAQSDTLIRSGVLFFFVSYTLTNLGAFISIIAISNKINSDTITDYSGLAKRSPMLAMALTICLVSLTGLPPTAGLFAKIYLFSGAVNQGLLWLVIIAVINSCISAFYYFKVVKYMWMGEPVSQDKVNSTWSELLAIGFCCILVVLIGIFPGIFVTFTQSAVSIFGL